MKVGLAFASSIGIDSESSLDICRRAETAGFESVWGGEHVIIPDSIGSKYSLLARRQDSRRTRHLHSGSPDMARLRRCGGPLTAAGHLHSDRAAAQPVGAGQRACDLGPAYRWAG